ncbi:MAG: magnesium/cobalt transporter CorA [Phycisphaerae bacterium]|nr:magnesium/cobalt transporter CorA [Phycisphaerae bacterium]
MSAPIPTPDSADPPGIAHVFLYDERGVDERRTTIGALADLIAQAKREDRRIWADMEIADRGAAVHELCRVLGVHPLSEDVLVARDHRPSVSEFPGFTHVIIEIVHVTHSMHFEKVDMLIGPNWLITVQDHPGDCFDGPRRRLRDEPEFRTRDTPLLLHALAESICLDYHRVLGRFGHRLEQLEVRLITRPAASLIHRIHAAKRDLRGFRRAIVPLRDSIETLFYANRRWMPVNNGEAAGGPELQLALREIHDELGGVIDVLDAYRDATQNLTDLYVTSASNRVNEILRVLTIISTIFIPLSFIAGVYGMNFRVFPELQWRYGYPLVLGVMLLVAAVLLSYFYRKGWLRRGDRVRTPSIMRTTSFLDESKHE